MERKDKMNWAQLIQEECDLNDVQSTEKERLLHDCTILKDSFGSIWLSEAALINHPWIAEFKNKVLWVKSVYGLIGERIFELESTEVLLELYQKLAIRTQ